MPKLPPNSSLPCWTLHHWLTWRLIARKPLPGPPPPLCVLHSVHRVWLSCKPPKTWVLMLLSPVSAPTALSHSDLKTCANFGLSCAPAKPVTSQNSGLYAQLLGLGAYLQLRVRLSVIALGWPFDATPTMPFRWTSQGSTRFCCWAWWKLTLILSSWPWSKQSPRPASTALWTFGRVTCILLLPACWIHPRLHLQLCCWGVSRKLGSLCNLADVGLMRLACLTRRRSTSPSCATASNGTGTTMSLLRFGTVKTFLACSGWTLPWLVAPLPHCHQMNSVSCVWALQAAFSLRMPMLIGMTGMVAANGVASLIHSSIATTNAATLWTWEPNLHQTFCLALDYSLMPWSYAVGLFCRPLTLRGSVCWTPSLVLFLPWLVGFGLELSIWCSLMVLVCGRPILTSVLPRGVRSLLAPLGIPGLSNMVVCLVLALSLDFVKRRTVVNCLPWPLCSTMLLLAASG